MIFRIKEPESMYRSFLQVSWRTIVGSCAVWCATEKRELGPTASVVCVMHCATNWALCCILRSIVTPKSHLAAIISGSKQIQMQVPKSKSTNFPHHVTSPKINARFCFHSKIRLEYKNWHPTRPFPQLSHDTAVVSSWFLGPLQLSWSSNSPIGHHSPGETLYSIVWWPQGSAEWTSDNLHEDPLRTRNWGPWLLKMGSQTVLSLVFIIERSVQTWKTDLLITLLIIQQNSVSWQLQDSLSIPTKPHWAPLPSHTHSTITHVIAW